MNVLALVSDAFGSNGGIAKYNRDLLTAVSCHQNISSVVAITRSQPVPSIDLPIRLHYDVNGTRGRFSYIREVMRMLGNYRTFDLVLCCHINLLPVAYLAARIKGAPLWCTIFGIDAWQPSSNRLVNWIAGRLDGVVSISEITREHFLSWSGVAREKCYLLPNAYDPMDYGQAPKPGYLLDRYDLSGKTVLMTFGRISASEKYKGFDEVIDILPELKKKVPNVCYLIAGDGDDKQRLQSKVAMMGLSDCVVFAGFVPEEEKTDHYRLADLYVMPSRGEGFGFVVLEAMACGVPVVASKADGTREAVLNGKLGTLVDPAQHQEVVSVVLQALQQPKKGIPDGLEYFSCGAFRERCHKFLDKVFKDKSGENA